MTVVQIEVKPTCICMPATLYQIGVARPTELIWSLESDITTRIVNHIPVFGILNGFTNLASEFCIQWSSKIYAVGTYAQLFADGLDLCGGLLWRRISWNCICISWVPLGAKFFFFRLKRISEALLDNSFWAVSFNSPDPFQWFFAHEIL